ncbi:MAG: hypothetical protein L6R36_006501 [Xanthoria steineri]|nr:MAG: hypothetical protein L6R36_006501 [Xanthoria steineri]
MPGKNSDFPKRKERKAYFKTNTLPFLSELLLTQASMPEPNAFQPALQVVPSHGHREGREMGLRGIGVGKE